MPDIENTTVTEKPDDISAEIREAFKEVAEKSDVEAAPKEKVAEAATTDDKTTDKTIDKSTKEASTTADAPEEIKVAAPPKSWGGLGIKDSLKEKWSGLDPEIQNQIIKRESEVDKGFTRMDEERNFGKAMKEIVSPYLALINSEGGTPQKAFQEYLNAAFIMRQGTPEQKANVLRQAARQYGVDLGQVSSPARNVDPTIEAINQRLDRVTMTIEQQGQLKQQQEDAYNQNLIETFRNDPKNVHFEEVRDDMSLLLKSGRASDLQDAYDKAVYMNPQTRSAVMQANAADINGQRVAEKQAKAATAKKAAVSVRGGAGTAAPAVTAPSNGTVEDDVRAAFRAIQNN